MDLLGLGAVGREGVQETQADSSSTGGGYMRIRCYGIYGKPSCNEPRVQSTLKGFTEGISTSVRLGEAKGFTTSTCSASISIAKDMLGRYSNQCICFTEEAPSSLISN
jgi:hypothetical protein